MNNQRYVAVFLAKTKAFQWVGAAAVDEHAMAATHHAVGIWEIYADQDFVSKVLEELSLTLVSVTASQAAELERWAAAADADLQCPVSLAGGREYTHSEVLFMLSPDITPVNQQCNSA
jgi:hypothetical protein